MVVTIYNKIHNENHLTKKRKKEKKTNHTNRHLGCITVVPTRPINES